MHTHTIIVTITVSEIILNQWTFWKNFLNTSYWLPWIFHWHKTWRKLNFSIASSELELHLNLQHFNLRTFKRVLSWDVGDTSKMGARSECITFMIWKITDSLQHSWDFKCTLSMVKNGKDYFKAKVIYL